MTTAGSWRRKRMARIPRPIRMNQASAEEQEDTLKRKKASRKRWPEENGTKLKDF